MLLNKYKKSNKKDKKRSVSIEVTRGSKKKKKINKNKNI